MAPGYVFSPDKENQALEAMLLESPLISDQLCACTWHVPQLHPAPSAAPGSRFLAKSRSTCAKFNFSLLKQTGSTQCHSQSRKLNKDYSRVLGKRIQSQGTNFLGPHIYLHCSAREPGGPRCCPTVLGIACSQAPISSRSGQRDIAALFK